MRYCGGRSFTNRKCRPLVFSLVYTTSRLDRTRSGEIRNLGPPGTDEVANIKSL